MKYKPVATFLILAATLFIASCGNNPPNKTSATGDWEGFEMSPVKGSENQHAIKKNDDGGTAEEGFALNGNKNGTWITYHLEGRIKSVENFIDGRVEGLSLELDKRGQIIKKVYYVDGQFHGPNTTYKFGRPQETIPYNHGNVHGMVVRYYNNGRVMEEIDFVDGVQHGYYNHYNADEKLDMRYEYSKGEKVSGGMVDPDQEN